MNGPWWATDLTKSAADLTWSVTDLTTSAPDLPKSDADRRWSGREVPRSMKEVPRFLNDQGQSVPDWPWSERNWGWSTLEGWHATKPCRKGAVQWLPTQALGCRRFHRSTKRKYTAGPKAKSMTEMPQVRPMKLM